MVRFAPAFALAALLGACASLPEAGGPLPGGFELSGRVAVRHGKDAASGRIFWRHSDESDELLITSALGQGIARISREHDRFRLVTGDRVKAEAAAVGKGTPHAAALRKCDARFEIGGVRCGGEE